MPTTSLSRRKSTRRTSISCSSDRRLGCDSQRSTPEIAGVLTRISADTTTDQRTGQSFYVIRVAMSPEEVARLGEVKLLPGMPVEAFVQTGERTVLSYLMRPLRDQFMRTFREK